MITGGAGNALAALRRLDRRFERLAHIPQRDYVELLEEYARIMIEDNRKGILEGTDKDGNPMVPVRYRPKASTGTRTPARPRSGPFSRGKTAFLGAPSGAFKGRAAARNGNLTSAQYRKLTGPPLAPRYAQSRVITNFKVAVVEEAENHWAAKAKYDQVLSNRGVPFLPFHFNGAGRLPRRDLRGVRPWGFNEAKRVTRIWAYNLLKKARDYARSG